ncbi:MAG: hypothetical protein P9M14_04855 [Candidatus Alcyoniella australis]|nr:hypothetical protein [Candidatus Alcyoniella australis]
MNWEALRKDGHTSATRIHNAFRDRWFDSKLKDYGKPGGLFEVQADLAADEIWCNDVMFRQEYRLADYGPEQYRDWQVAK